MRDEELLSYMKKLLVCESWYFDGERKRETLDALDWLYVPENAYLAMKGYEGLPKRIATTRAVVLSEGFLERYVFPDFIQI